MSHIFDPTTIVAEDINVIVRASIQADLSGVTDVEALFTLNGVSLPPRPATVEDDGTATGTALVTFDVGTLPESGILLVDLVFTYGDGSERTSEDPISFPVRNRLSVVQ